MWAGMSLDSVRGVYGFMEIERQNIMENKKTVFLFGGRICEELYNRKIFSGQYDVIRMESMLSYHNFPYGIKDNEICRCKYDLVIIDMQAVVEELIQENISQEQLIPWVRQLGGEILQCFTADRVVMLHVFRPPYYIIENRLRIQSDKPYTELIESVEKAFLEQCECHVISLHNCYFSCKPYGGELSLYGFEEEYYQEVAARIDSYLFHQNDIFGESAKFAYAVERFRKYFWTLEKKAFLLFLDSTHILENFVLCSTPEFLDKYRDTILKLAEVCGTNGEIACYRMAIEDLECNHKAEFMNVLEAFDAVLSQQYERADVDYLSLFVNGMRISVLLDELRKWAGENLKNLGLVHRKQVTFYNYGAYFMWKQTGSRESFHTACDAIRRALDVKISEKPAVVDIWGSCVSRINLNFDDERTLVTSAYHFQVLPFVETTPVVYEKNKIAECKTWHDNLVRKQLDGTTIAELEHSPAKWLIVDFFSLSSQRLYCYQGRYFTDYHEKACKLLGAEKCSVKDISPDEVFRRLRVFAEVIKKRYGTHIIFIQSKRQESYITQELQIQDFKEKEKKWKTNQFVYELSRYFVNLTKCYYIDIADHFLSDETGFMKLSDVHYENKCYEETLKLIRYIMDHEPEKHWYQSCSLETVQKRNIRFQNSLGQKLVPCYKPVKIGLISINMYSKGLNFACPLHTYAFQSFLNQRGINNIVIDYKPVYFDDFQMDTPYLYYSKRCENLFQRKQAALENGREDPTEVAHKQEIMARKRNSWEMIGPERIRRYQKFQKFIEKYYYKTDTCYNPDTLEFIDPGCDCYICVTDVIWKKEPYWGFDRGFFLGSTIMENKYKIAYAASRDVNFVQTKEDEEQILHYIEDIDSISVRERSLKNYLEQHTDRQIEQVLDPVFLVDKSLYEDILCKPEEENYIFLYWVVEDASDTVMQAVNYARKYDLTIIETSDQALRAGAAENYEGVRTRFIYDMGIEEWLGYIYYAQCIFTNSFHGISMSIIFEKEFFAGYRSEDKLINLLELLRLRDRVLSTDKDWVENLQEKIDYDKVSLTLKEQREISERFILNAIEKARYGKDFCKDYSELKKNLRYSVYFNTGEEEGAFQSGYEVNSLNYLVETKCGLEYQPQNYFLKNDGNSVPRQNQFVREGYQFIGWNIRVKIDTEYFWYLEIGGFACWKDYQRGKDAKLYLLTEGDPIPSFPLGHIKRVVLTAVWKKEPAEYTISYINDRKMKKITWSYTSEHGEVHKNSGGVYSFTPHKKIQNNRTAEFEKNKFTAPGYLFKGYYFRILQEKQWYWYMEDGTWSETRSEKVRMFQPKDEIPVICGLDFVSAEAYSVWEKTFTENRFGIYYYTAKCEEKISWDYDESDGQLVRNPSGSFEYRCKGQKVINDGKYMLKKNCFHRKGYEFSGWKLRVKCKDVWYWYMKDHTLKKYDQNIPQKEFAENKAVLLDGDRLPVLMMDEITLVVAEAVWKKKEDSSLKGKLMGMISK